MKLTPQLAIWRKLWIEDDATTNIRALMTTGTTNRQDNRFADAFLDPAYLPSSGINITPLAATTVNLNDRTGKLSQNGDDAIWAARDTKALESPVFWIAYVGNTFTRENPIPVPGFTVNTTSDVTGTTNNNAYQASVLFSPNNAARWPVPATRLIVEQKIAVHEVAHQIMRNANHRGRPADIERYRNATTQQQADAVRWRERINIMNEDAVAVVMSNAAEGPNDLFYFHSEDVAQMRSRRNSPGTPD